MTFDKLKSRKGIENKAAPEHSRGWEIKKLGEIADVEYGFTDKSTEDGDFRYVRITDIDNNGELISTDKKYLKHSKEAEGFLIRDNDLLMARTGATFAKVLLYQDFEPSVFASYLIRINFKEKIDNKLYWYFTKTKSYWEQANSLASGAAQPHFNGAAVKQVIFSYPKSLPEQQRIVSILDKAFAAIDQAKANAEQNLKNAKELFESYSEFAFNNNSQDWKDKTLGDVCSLYQGIAINAKTRHAIVEKSDLPLLRIKDLRNNTVEQFIDPNNYPKNALVTEEDIIYTRTGNSLGLVFRGRRGVLHNNSFKIVPTDELSRDYLFNWLQNPKFKSKIFGLAFKAAQPDITHAIFKIQEIKIPTLKEQQNIVQNIDAMRAETQKMEAIYQKKMDDLEELKKSILQKAFAGELRGGEPAESETDTSATSVPIEYEINDNLSKAAEPTNN